MGWFLLIVTVLIVCFAFVILFGAPYLPTLRPQIEAALDLLALEPGQTMLELGCGDGRILAAAAKRGWHCVGYELNPIMALVARLRTWRYRSQVRIVWGDFWRADWPAADGIFAFILPRFMARLNTKIAQQKAHRLKVVSFAFKIPKQPIVAERDGVFLYQYD